MFRQQLIEFKSITFKSDVAIMLNKGFFFLKIFVVFVICFCSYERINNLAENPNDQST